MLCNNTMVIKMKISLIISILFLIIFNSLSLAADNNRISKYEREALISLYLSTGGDQWTSNKGWKDGQLESDGFSYSGSECNWFGVICDKQKTKVIEIILSANNLSGILPSKIGNFKNMKNLNFWVNKISGMIPDEICKLNQLELLCLGSNKFRGNIPNCVGNLQNLKYLYFDTNSLTGTIPKEICTLSKLEILSLHSNSLNGNIPDNLGLLSNLRELNLFKNSLTGLIPKGIGALNKLEKINIHSNELLGLIPLEITKLPGLIDGESNLCGNMLSTDSDLVKEFINRKQYGIMWEKCQRTK